jgi:regulator of sigma E protease
MSGLIMAAQLLLALSFLVFVHELGHFLAARAFGIKVEKFFIFFDWGGKIYSKKIGDTEYGIGIFPLGGYVKIAGMIDESMDKEQMKKPPQPWEFRSKPAWQRLIVMVAGVVMNVIVGVLIFTLSHLGYNKEYVSVGDIEEGIYAYEYAQKMGLETGDEIVSIDGKKVERFSDIMSTKLFFGNEITVIRNNENITIPIPDTLYSYFASDKYNVSNYGPFIGFDNYPLSIDSIIKDKNAYNARLKASDKIIGINSINIDVVGDFKKELYKNRGDTVVLEIIRQDSIQRISVLADSMGMIGIVLKRDDLPTTKYTFFSAMKFGWKDAFESIRANAKGLGKVFSGKEKARDSLQGPIGIAKIFGGTWNWMRFWSITGLLSMVLAFVNILPIPALDGGHVLFTLIEMVIGRKLPDKFMETVQIIGLIIVMGLIVFVIGNDIINLF